jgi:mRNA-degrading endonuclease YafQ of YafQ-DinJ toxin-antitoxin module
MLRLQFSNTFKKDYKRMVSRGCKEEHFDEVVKLLILGNSSPYEVQRP